MELHEKLFLKSLTEQTFEEGEGILFGGRRGKFWDLEMAF